MHRSLHTSRSTSISTQEPDVEVFEQRQRWEVTRAMAEASRRSDEGHFEEARQLLRQRRKTLAGCKSAITEVG